MQKLCFLGSSCIYPRLAPQPIREDALLTGPLEPTNLYGPGDNFDLENSHVLPALIRRFHEAKLRGDPEVTVWGTGTPRREFLCVDDLAAAVVHLMGSYESEELVNIGCGEEVSILELAELVAPGWKPTIGLEEGLRGTYEWFVANQVASPFQFTVLNRITDRSLETPVVV